MTERVSVVIPTMNRSEFLIRLLRYYRDIGFQGRICIGDSSDTYHLGRIKSAVESLGGELKIDVVSDATLTVARVLREVSESVSTPYTVLVGDDDFLIPNGLERCVRFLEDHAEYTAAHGLGVVFSLESSGAYGEFRSVCRYRLRASEATTASQRLLEYFADPFVPLFSVHRIEAWRAMCRDGALISDRSFADELLPCSLSVIQGRVKELDCLYLVRQDHPGRYLRSDVYDWIMSPSWFSSYLVFRERVAEELARRDGIGIEDAREVVKRGFWLFLGRSLTRRWEACYTRRTAESGSRLRDARWRMSRLKDAVSAVRSLIGRRQDEISVRALLVPRSRYHTDFMPIYRAVTNGGPSAGGGVALKAARQGRVRVIPRRSQFLIQLFRRDRR